MRSPYQTRERVQHIFECIPTLSLHQRERVGLVVIAMIVSQSVMVSRIASYLPKGGQLASRIRYITRLLDVIFVTHERVYKPALQYVLRNYKAKTWHIVIDRTTLWDQSHDLLTVALSYRRRAIPLVWCLVPFGGGSQQDTIDLIKQVPPLIPDAVYVILHGDTEFGAVSVMKCARHLGWDFMLARTGSTHFRRVGHHKTAPLNFADQTAPDHLA